MSPENKKFNYSTALHIFLGTEESYRFHLDVYDICYLATIANAQNLNPQIQTCIMKIPTLAKISRICVRKIKMIEPSLEERGLVERKRKWKLYHRILSPLIAPHPPNWCLKNGLRCTPCTLSGAHHALDQVHGVHLTIEMLEKEKIDKERELRASRLSPDFFGIDLTKTKAICEEYGINMEAELSIFKDRVKIKQELKDREWQDKFLDKQWSIWIKRAIKYQLGDGK